MKGLPSKCNFEENYESNIVKQLNDKLILMKDVNDLEIESNCLPKRKISGNILIKLKNCSITVNNIKYEDQKTLFYEDIHIVPLLNSNITKNKIIEKLNLRKIQTYNFENKNFINKLNQQHTVHISLQYVISCLILIMIVTYLLVTIRNKPRTEKSKFHDSSQLEHNSPESNLKDGGVKCTSTQSLSYT